MAARQFWAMNLEVVESFHNAIAFIAIKITIVIYIATSSKTDIPGIGNRAGGQSAMRRSASIAFYRHQTRLFDGTSDGIVDGITCCTPVCGANTVTFAWKCVIEAHGAYCRMARAPEQMGQSREIQSSFAGPGLFSTSKAH